MDQWAFLLLFCVLATFGVPGFSFALEPEQVLVLANRNAARSVGLAREYMEKRAIPEDQLLALWVTDKETCAREDYEVKVSPSVRIVVTCTGQPREPSKGAPSAVRSPSRMHL